jgi:hypothetical protein
MGWNFESIVNISKITGKYLNPGKPETKFTEIESRSVVNKGSMIIQKTLNFFKPYVVATKWTNQLDFISDYFIT